MIRMSHKLCISLLMISIDHEKTVEIILWLYFIIIFIVKMLIFLTFFTIIFLIFVLFIFS